MTTSTPTPETEIEARKPVVPVDVAMHVLWHFGDYNYGRQGGKFVERLLLTLSAADAENRTKLAREYPEYAMAFLAVQMQTWGLDWLQRIVRGAGA